jgi:ribosomal-protein-alanine N-acetyltransferase
VATSRRLPIAASQTKTASRGRELDPPVRLERPSLRREREYLAAVRRSRDLHRGFVTCAAVEAEYRKYLRRAGRRSQESYFVVSTALDELVGVVNLNDIVRYSLQSARLGYYAFVPHAGRGWMRAGLELVLAEAFGRLRLHRVEANVQPANRRSIALVRSLGFRREGVARGYLKIGRRWQDHERWALLADDWRDANRSTTRRRSAAQGAARRA